MIKFVFRSLISFLLYKIIQGIIVNNKCPNINPVQDFKYPANDVPIIWKMHSHLPTDKDQEFIQPLNFASNISFDCAQFWINKTENDYNFFIYVYIQMLSDINLFKLTEFYMNVPTSITHKHKYGLFYENIEVSCDKTIVYGMELVAAMENYYLVYWICEDFYDNSSFQAALILVNENLTLQKADEEFIMKILGKKSSDFILTKNNTESICGKHIDNLFQYDCEADPADDNEDSEENEEITNNDSILFKFIVIILVLVLVLILIIGCIM